MSDTKQQNRIDRLMASARRSQDPEQLRRIVGELESISAWDEAIYVRYKAEAMEQHYAEQAAK